MGFWDYVILIAVALLAALAVFLIVKRRKAGKCTCGECAGCLSGGYCHGLFQDRVLFKRFAPHHFL